jgi:hypothetical protein
LPTYFLVHGNLTGESGAIEFAWPCYSLLKIQHGDHPFRIVIWSWPSTRTSNRHRRDAQTKSFYSDSQSYYLADCLRKVRMQSQSAPIAPLPKVEGSVGAESPVTLIGYSFGARIIAGGLHLLGDGELGGHRLSALEGNAGTHHRVPVRAILVAAALDCHALLPGYRYGNAASQAEEIVVTRNGFDPVLRWYRLLYGRGGPDALGYAGLCCSSCSNVKILDVSCSVGKSHQWECYFASGIFETLASQWIP